MQRSLFPLPRKGERTTMPRLVIISDTHGPHRSLTLPDGDILIHAGDITEHGTLAAVQAFDECLGQFPHTYKIVIAGNHDFCFEDESAEAQSLLTNATYLQDQAIEIMGVKFFGSPWTPEFFNWAFMRPRGEEMRTVWEQVPADTDVLISHGPPKGIFDLTYAGENAGCDELLAAVREIMPKFHIFGHIHEGRGVKRGKDTTFLNASSVSPDYRQIYPPYVVEVD
ncbi:MAG: metallophosphatase domain-containing protein [Anaerolineales bacterium]|jgi:Icc-related predicted phosphoesterase